MSRAIVNKGGRPSAITDSVLSKLEEAYLMGCSDREACLLSQISPSALYRYQEAHPEFRERKKTLQKALTIKARKIIQRDLEEGDSITAKWYLERKEKQEFSAKADIDINNKFDSELTIEEREKALDKLLEQFMPRKEIK